MGHSNFPHFCKHGREETCYTEAAEVLRWQTGAAWQKRRRSCQTNCDKAKIDLAMENADTVSYKLSAKKSLTHFWEAHCRNAMITLLQLTSSTATDTYSPKWLLSSTGCPVPLEWAKSLVVSSQMDNQPQYRNAPYDPGHEGPLEASSTLLHIELQKSCKLGQAAPLEWAGSRRKHLRDELLQPLESFW